MQDRAARNNNNAQTLARLVGARQACHGDILMVGSTVKDMLKCCGMHNFPVVDSTNAG